MLLPLSNIGGNIPKTSLGMLQNQIRGQLFFRFTDQTIAPIRRIKRTINTNNNDSNNDSIFAIYDNLTMFLCTVVLVGCRCDVGCVRYELPR